MTDPNQVGTPQSEDILILAEPNHPERMFWGGFSDDGHYAFMKASQDTSRSSLFWIADLRESPIGPDMKWHKIVNEWGAYYSKLTNDGSLFYFFTNKDAPNHKIVTYDLEKPELGFVDVVPHDEKRLLSSIHITGDKILLIYSVDVKDVMTLHDLKTGALISRIGEDLIGSVAQVRLFCFYFIWFPDDSLDFWTTRGFRTLPLSY